MKAKPVKLTPRDGYVQCPIDMATHVSLRIPGPTGLLTLPVIRKGARAGTGCWTWNGSTDAPTLRPSVLTTGHDWRCHSWINDGAAQFLGDCSHSLANTTVPLLEVDGGQPEHVATADCWCQPEANYVDPETGATVYVHREVQ